MKWAQQAPSPLVHRRGSRADAPRYPERAQPSTVCHPERAQRAKDLPGAHGRGRSRVRGDPSSQPAGRTHAQDDTGEGWPAAELLRTTGGFDGARSGRTVLGVARCAKDDDAVVSCAFIGQGAAQSMTARNDANKHRRCRRERVPRRPAGAAGPLAAACVPERLLPRNSWFLPAASAYRAVLMLAMTMKTRRLNEKRYHAAAPAPTRPPRWRHRRARRRCASPAVTRSPESVASRRTFSQYGRASARSPARSSADASWKFAP